MIVSAIKTKELPFLNKLYGVIMSEASDEYQKEYDSLVAHQVRDQSLFNDNPVIIK